MSYKGPQKVQKVMVQPINLIFRYLQNRSRVQVWLFENITLRIEGHIVGFDEYMNLVLDDAEEYHVKTDTRKPLGRIMLKGDNITLIQNTNPSGNWGRNLTYKPAISVLLSTRSMFVSPFCASTVNLHLCQDTWQFSLMDDVSFNDVLKMIVWFCTWDLRFHDCNDVFAN